MIGRRLAAALTIALAITVGACSDDDPTGSGGDVNGMWLLESNGETAYVFISPDQIVFYDEGEGCFTELALEVVDIDGDVYTVDFFGTDLEVEIRRSGDGIRIDGGAEVVAGEPTDVDPDDLDICAESGFDPTLGACASYPALPLGETVDAALSEGDEIDASGFVYDLYRIDLATTADVEISMTSAEVDAYLYLYSSTGTLIASNDDADVLAPGDALIEEPGLGAGCYIVAASTWSEGEAGAYTIGATAF